MVSRGVIRMLPYLVVVLGVVILFHIFIYHKYNWPRYVRVVNKIPGPPGIFYFGSTLRYYRLKNEELLPDIINDFKIYGTTFKHWYSGVAVVFVSELEDVQTILSSRLSSSKGALYKNILPWLGTGLLTSSGEKWHLMRKIISPTFHFSILHGYVDIFNKNAKALARVLNKELETSREFDLSKHVTYCTLDNVCETAMGITLNSLTTGDDNKYVQSIFRIGKIIVHRMFSPVLFTDHNFWLSPMGREHSKLLKVLHGFTSKIIKEKKELQTKNGGLHFTEPATDEFDCTVKKSFLEMLLENQVTYSLTAENIREEVDTFMFEGHDTTAASITWTLFELGHNVGIQDKVYEELKEIFGDSDRPATYQDLMQMGYLKRVIQEVLRLYPSVPVISRKFDVDLQIRDYLVPANTEIVLVLYHIHRNPKIYPDPEKFDPDRFLPHIAEKRHPFAYIPFSAGQRNCIGQKFAMLEELVIISTIIRQYKICSITKRESVKVVPEMILRPSEKILWQISKRV